MMERRAPTRYPARRLSRKNDHEEHRKMSKRCESTTLRREHSAIEHPAAMGTPMLLPATRRVNIRTTGHGGDAPWWLGFVFFALVSTLGAEEDTVVDQLRVLTYNIHHGEGTDGKLDLPRIAAVIQRLNPHVVALQEVDNRTTRAAGVDQAAELGRLTGMHSVFGKAMEYAGGEYGLAILSRYPLDDVRVLALPVEPNHEPRSILVAQVRIGNERDFFFASTHLEHAYQPLRMCQAGKISSLLAPIRAPLVLAGDFNDIPGSPVINVLQAHWGDLIDKQAEPTWPSDAPRMKLDYVLTRPADAWQVMEVQVVAETVASDHRPVLAILKHRGKG
jgi:endonuclease/exonuclease/phosphatase family metal-dependent hydrolase